MGGGNIFRLKLEKERAVLFFPKFVAVVKACATRSLQLNYD